MLPFTTEEAWLDRHPEAKSVHLQQFPQVPSQWRDEAPAEKWRKMLDAPCHHGCTGYCPAGKAIGSSLEAVPVVLSRQFRAEQEIAGIDMAEISITSGLDFSYADVPAGAFTLDDVKGVAVVVEKAADRGLSSARARGATPTTSATTMTSQMSRRAMLLVLHELQASGRIRVGRSARKRCALLSMEGFEIAEDKLSPHFRLRTAVQDTPAAAGSDQGAVQSEVYRHHR